VAQSGDRSVMVIQSSELLRDESGLAFTVTHQPRRVYYISVLWLKFRVWICP